MLPLISLDKANHFIYGNAVAVVTVVATTYLAPELRQFAGIAAATMVGVLKELADAILNYKATGSFREGPHGVELLDVIATASGGISTIQF
jgi:hypothetical protein